MNLDQMVDIDNGKWWQKLWRDLFNYYLTEKPVIIH